MSWPEGGELECRGFVVAIARLSRWCLHGHRPLKIKSALPRTIPGRVDLIADMLVIFITACGMRETEASLNSICMSLLADMHK